MYIQIGDSIPLCRLDKEPFTIEEIGEAADLKEERIQEQVDKSCLIFNNTNY